jgi:hypothetical protein
VESGFEGVDELDLILLVSPQGKNLRDETCMKSRGEAARVKRLEAVIVADLSRRPLRTSVTSRRRR